MRPLLQSKLMICCSSAYLTFLTGSLPVPVPVALWPRRQQAALVYEDTCSNCSMLDLLNAQIAQCSNCSMLDLLNARFAQCSICSMLDLLNAQSPQKNAQKALCLVKIQNSKIQNCGKAATIQNSKFKIQNSKFKNHLITFSTSSMFLSNGPLCSSFSVHMAAANLPASVMLSPCERQ